MPGKRCSDTRTLNSFSTNRWSSCCIFFFFLQSPGKPSQSAAWTRSGLRHVSYSGLLPPHYCYKYLEEKKTFPSSLRSAPTAQLTSLAVRRRSDYRHCGDVAGDSACHFDWPVKFPKTFAPGHAGHFYLISEWHLLCVLRDRNGEWESHGGESMSYFFFLDMSLAATVRADPYTPLRVLQPTCSRWGSTCDYQEQLALGRVTVGALLPSDIFAHMPYPIRRQWPANWPVVATQPVRHCCRLAPFQTLCRVSACGLHVQGSTSCGACRNVRCSAIRSPAELIKS